MASMALAGSGATAATRAPSRDAATIWKDVLDITATSSIPTMTRKTRGMMSTNSKAAGESPPETPMSIEWISNSISSSARARARRRSCRPRRRFSENQINPIPAPETGLDSPATVPAAAITRVAVG